MWSDEFPDPVIPNFDKATGIKVNQTPFSQNEEQINKLQATGGEGFDLCQPTQNRAPQYKDLQRSRALRHEPLKNTGNIIPSMLKSADRAVDLGWRHLPHAALLGFRSHFLPHRPVEGRSGQAQLRFALGRGRQGPYAGPRTLLPARHRPVVGCQRQDAVQPHARRLQGRRELQEALGSDPCLRHRAQGLGQAVLGFGRQHQVGPDGERCVDRPDLGWSRRFRSRRKASQ